MKNTESRKHEINGEVVAFLAEFLRVPVETLGAETTLVDDLGVDGDDGRDLMEAFATRFNVDLASFSASEHFGPEAGWNPLAFLYYVVFPGQSELRPVTIRDLVEAAGCGKWASSPARGGILADEER